MEQATDLEIEAAMLAEASELVAGGERGETLEAVEVGAETAAGAVPGTMLAETPATGADAAVGDDEDSDVDVAAGTGAGDEYYAAADNTDDAEFNADVDRDVIESEEDTPPVVDEAALLAAMAPDSAPLAPHPPAPGSPESPFRACDCLGTMPGRACIRCGGSRWTKQCTAAGCGGTGKLSTPNRNASGPPRVERCGFCMGRGLVPARGAEVTVAQNLHNESVEAEKLRKARQVFATPAKTAADAANISYNRVIQRRKPVLPAAGKPKQKSKSKSAKSTSTKK